MHARNCRSRVLRALASSQGWPGPEPRQWFEFSSTKFLGLILGLTISVAVPCSNAVLMAFCAVLEPRPCDALKDSVAVEVVSLSVPVRSFGVPFHG